MDYARLDFETASTVDLRKTGVAVYAGHPETRIICGACTIPGEGAHSWTFRERPPKALLDWVADKKPVAAWNATFEWYIWNFILLRDVKSKPRMRSLRLENTYCSMAQAAYWGLPLSLETAAEALPQLGIRKDKKGHALMMRMNKPRSNGTWWHETEPDYLDRLLAYCRQDVRVEQKISEYLPELPQVERKTWISCFNANLRGLRYDVDLGNKMKTLAKSELSRLDAKVALATGDEVSSTRKVAGITSWAEKHSGVALGSLAKDRLIEHLADPGIPNFVKQVLRLRQEAAKSSVAKLDAMERWAATPGDAMHGLVQHYGAFRSGRFAGRGPQIQNYPRPLVKDQEALIRFLGSGQADAEGMMAFFGVTVLDGISSALRGCIRAQDGYLFAAIDFSQIEARVLAWLAGELSLLAAFRKGRDVYVERASVMFGISQAKVSDDQRSVAKVAVLAGGYAGGLGAFQGMFRNYGIFDKPDAEVEALKVSYRKANPAIVKYWKKVNDAAIMLVSGRKTRFSLRAYTGGPKIIFSLWRNMLLIELPSGRHLVYREPHLAKGIYGPEVRYSGMDQLTRKWKVQNTYGGELVATITQGTARDLLVEAIHRLDKTGFQVLGSIHDETLLGIKDDAHSENLFSQALRSMRIVPVWAEGLPLDADGYMGERFRK